MLKYLLCFAPTVLCAIIIPIIGLLGRGQVDVTGLGSVQGKGDYIDNEGVFAVTMGWVIVTGWIGIGLAICMGIYDIFSWWEKSRERKRIERVLAEDRAREALDTNPGPRP
jgi:hypothetical protein